MFKYFKTIKRKLAADISFIPQPFQNNYYPALDGLRGIAILMVVLTHFGFNDLMPFNTKVDSNIAVHIFFVLSGFLITTLLLKEKINNNNISIKRFYARRILRIVPLAYLFLIVLIIIGICYKQTSSVEDFVLSFLFLKNLPVQNHPFTASLWTLSVEEQFYIFLPFLLSFNINKYFYTAFILSVTIPLMAIAGHFGSYPSDSIFYIIVKVSNYLFWKGPIIILIGSVTAILALKGILTTASADKYYFLSFFLVVIAIIIHNKVFLFYCPYVSEYLSAIIMAYVILLCTKTDNFLSKLLSNRLLIKIGLLSYSLYMWQQLFIGRIFWLPGLKSINAYPIAVIILVKLCILFPISFASYYLFEKVFLKMKERYR